MFAVTPTTLLFQDFDPEASYVFVRTFNFVKDADGRREKDEEDEKNFSREKPETKFRTRFENAVLTLPDQTCNKNHSTSGLEVAAALYLYW